MNTLEQLEASKIKELVSGRFKSADQIKALTAQAKRNHWDNLLELLQGYCPKENRIGGKNEGNSEIGQMMKKLQQKIDFEGYVVNGISYEHFQETGIPESSRNLADELMGYGTPTVLSPNGEDLPAVSLKSRKYGRAIVIAKTRNKGYQVYMWSLSTFTAEIEDSWAAVAVDGEVDKTTHRMMGGKCLPTIYVESLEDVKKIL